MIQTQDTTKTEELAATWQSAQDKAAADAAIGKGPVNCTHILRAMGHSYPRSCHRCGLGPCPFYQDDTRPKETPTEQGEVARYGWTFYGPDGEWHWSAEPDNHEAVTDQRPATSAEAQFAAALSHPAPTNIQVAEAKIVRRWKVDRPEGARADHLKVPAWVQQRQLVIGGYLEQGWTAFDQTNSGRIVATGEWGHEMAELADGTIVCTNYPLGYPTITASSTTKGDGE